MPDRYAVFGNPVYHSLSPQIHLLFAQQEKSDLTYERILAPLDGFEAAVEEFRANGGKGCNVTVPFKVEAYALGAPLSRDAYASGAVNTLKFGDKADRSDWVADNTDGRGFLLDLKRLGFKIKGKKVLVCGSGGAARGLLPPLCSGKAKRVAVAARTLGRLDDMRSALGFDEFDFETLREFKEGDFDLIVNATSASLAGESLPIRKRLYQGCELAYDLAYGPEPTRFQIDAAENGAKRAEDGLGMLVCQAALSYEIWRGFRPNLKPVLQQLRNLKSKKGRKVDMDGKAEKGGKGEKGEKGAKGAKDSKRAKQDKSGKSPKSNR